MNQKNNEGFRDVYLLRIRVKTFILISWSYFSSFSNRKVFTNIIRQEKKNGYTLSSFRSMKAAHGNTLWHAPFHHVLRNNKRRRICMKKVAFTFIFNSKSLLHYSDIIQNLWVLSLHQSHPENWVRVPSQDLLDNFPSKPITYTNRPQGINISHENFLY